MNSGVNTLRNLNLTGIIQLKRAWNDINFFTLPELFFNP